MEENSINFTKYLKSKTCDTIEGESIHRYQYFAPCSYTENITYCTIHFKPENIAKKIHDILLTHFEEKSFTVSQASYPHSFDIGIEVMLKLCTEDMLLYETLLNHTSLLAVPVEQEDILAVTDPDKFKASSVYGYKNMVIEKDYDSAGLSAGMLYLNAYYTPIRPIEYIIINTVVTS